MAGVINPGQRQGLLDQVAKGLSIARDIYGIKSAMDESKYRDQQRADETAGNVSANEFTKDIAPKYDIVDDGTPGSTKIGVRRGEGVEQLSIMPKKPKATGPETRSLGNSLIAQDPKTGEWKPVYTAPQKPEKPKDQELITIDTGDEIKIVPKVAGASYTKAKKPGQDQDDAYKKLSKPDQIAVDTLGKSIADKTTIATQIDQQLANLKKSWSEGNVDLAVTQGQEMLKILNSDMGKDAVGTEEANRLGKFLEYKLANFTGPGSFHGRDVEQFFKQAAQKNNSIKAAIADSKKQVAAILAGKGAPELPTSETEIGPKGGAGTALAKQPPKVGELVDGYEFLGGDPADQKNWKKK